MIFESLLILAMSSSQIIAIGLGASIGDFYSTRVHVDFGPSRLDSNFRGSNQINEIPQWLNHLNDTLATSNKLKKPGVNQHS